MIPKVIERKSGSNFQYLGKYILDAKQAEDAVLWTRTAEYVMDTKGDGDKLAWYRLTHCESDTPAMAIAEILLTQSENTRAKGDKSYHLVISFREGEHPTREQLEDIEDHVCEGLGLGEHQRISAVHTNTENTHMHIAINKVHPVSHRLIDPYYPYLKLDKLCRELEIKHGLEVDNRIGQRGQLRGRAAEMEAHTGEESLLSWIKEHLTDSLLAVQKTGQSWAELHKVLSEHDLLIKPRGAGLVITTRDGQLGVKASSVHRSLSLNALTKRFGEYCPPSLQQAGEPVKQSYQRKPRQRHPQAKSLWSQYQREKETLLQNKKMAFTALREEHAHYGDELRRWYAEQRATIKSNTRLTSRNKRTLYNELSIQMKADFAKRKEQERNQRGELRQDHLIIDWEGWLAQKASDGHKEALGVLRSRQVVRQRLALALLTADDIQEAKHIIYPHLKPKTQRNGEVVYRLSDGGVIEDGADAVRIPQATEASTLFALNLAQERFNGKPLKVEGSDDFKMQIAEMAAIQGLHITFDDVDLETTRQRKQLSREMAKNGKLERSETPGLKPNAEHGYSR